MSKVGKLSVGYRVMPEETEFFWEVVADYRESISEVYFAWPGQASGRAPVEEKYQEQILWELEKIKKLGIQLNLLLNASCYGRQALSSDFAREIVSLVGFLIDRLGIGTITTMSPLVAETIKKNFPKINRRASVNMRLGTIAALKYVQDFFEGYCLQREYNRDTSRLSEIQAWAIKEGKELQILANSGCLNFCSFQTFHDNAVAHEKEMDSNRVSDLPPLCRQFYKHPRHRLEFLQNSSWIRPEDIQLHQQIFFGSYKLATRMHGHPRMVLAAYHSGRYQGNLLDLLEPGFSEDWWPLMVDNTRFPPDWFSQVLTCAKNCWHCDFCCQVAGKVMISLSPEDA
ncbi:MAG: hypothetical protein NC911_04600 [Candidatus Omnitrophica bacterium]|nr:hypothetical protein [Candidatus Omnitrophota bacterium]